MKSNIKLFSTYIILSLLIVFGTFVLAGTVYEADPPMPTMATLDDIYNLIKFNEIKAVDGASHDYLYPTVSTTTNSFHSLSEIYAELANLVQREKVATGTVFLGVTGDYGNVDPSRSTTTIISSSFTPVVSAGTSFGYSIADIYDLINNVPTIAGAHQAKPDTSINNNSLSGVMSSVNSLYNDLLALGSSKSIYISSDTTYLGYQGTYDPLSDVSFVDGDGTSGNPYQIENWAQLSKIRYDLTAYYVLNSNLSSSVSGYEGIGDDWTPLGNSLNNFTGNFNGNGNTISDLIINLPEITGVGLFGYSSGSIYDVGLLNVNISGFGNVGALVGFSNGEIISDSYSTGSVSGSSYVGGLVGVASAITNSFSTADVTADEYVGGLAGYIIGNISNTYAGGAVTGSGNYVGGLVGRADLEVYTSYSVGAVSGSGANVGGLVGLLSPAWGRVYDSYWDIDTSGLDTSGGGTGTTSSAMLDQNTYSGWNFGEIWSISAGYPYLLGLEILPAPEIPISCNNPDDVGDVDCDLWTVDDTSNPINWTYTARTASTTDTLACIAWCEEQRNSGVEGTHCNSELELQENTYSCWLTNDNYLHECTGLHGYPRAFTCN
jgi:hypothetical protein